MKYIKLLIIAVAIVGGLYALMEIIPHSKEIEKPIVTSMAGEAWKNKIDALCKDDAWTKTDYESIETGITMDMHPQHGNLTHDEGVALLNYLFAYSCLYLKDGASNLFRQSTYPPSKVSLYESALQVLKSKDKKDSNLAEANTLFYSYNVIRKTLIARPAATYTCPLKEYSGGDIESIIETIYKLPYFNSHFSHNVMINNALNELESSHINLEEKYYADLELCIEQHYANIDDISALLDDQIRFNIISTNEKATERLNNFVNGN